jgi:hypothetical protein
MSCKHSDWQRAESQRTVLVSMFVRMRELQDYFTCSKVFVFYTVLNLVFHIKITYWCVE